jgi:hypothetical protein
MPQTPNTAIAASISARTRSMSWATMREAPSCCGKNGRVAKWKRGSPKWQESRHPHCHFRGLLRLHSRYGQPDCSTAYSGLCLEAPALPVTRPNRSSATRSIDNSLGGILLHWRSAPSGRTASYGHVAAVVATKLGRFYIATAWSVCLEWVSAGSRAAEARSAFCRGETQSSGP